MKNLLWFFTARCASANCTLVRSPDQADTAIGQDAAADVAAGDDKDAEQGISVHRSCHKVIKHIGYAVFIAAEDKYNHTKKDC